ncbi:hypothetical protein [Candidatus Sodalis endolongispinus]|uniref:hypothetical protein n=1 Tax=Candidatus Sodalis endolongispinus TaxID=2812662 RepID=UPI0028AC554D|nr:hypothetical protein [Candidatus Sodalis endolongispinus]
MYKLLYSRQLYALLMYLVFLLIQDQVLAQTRLYTLSAPDGVKIAVQEAGNPPPGRR